MRGKSRSSAIPENLSGTPSPSDLLPDAIRRFVEKKKEFLELAANTGARCEVHTRSAETLLDSKVLTPGTT